MIRPSAIVFDYGGTLVESEECKFESGIDKLLSISVNPNNVTTNEIIEAFCKLDNEINIINQVYMIEASFRNYYRYVFEKFNITFTNTYEQLEGIFRREIFTYKPTEGILDFLNYLQNNQIRIGILSNNEFSGEVLSQEIKELLPGLNFEFVISSTDYYFRKPSPKIFEIAKSKMNLCGDKIWYVGDSFDADVLGAAHADMTPVWYNQFKNKRSENEKYMEAVSWLELQKYIETL